MMGLDSTTVLGRSMRAAVLLMASLGGASVASAAPFCMRNQIIAPQCIYYDAIQCQRDAQRQGAVCDVNPQEYHLLAGSGEYCVVTSSGASSCVYQDRPSCAAEAVRQQGMCAAATPSRPARIPDPYSALNGQ